MRSQRILSMWLILVMLAFPVAAHAAEGSRLRLSASDTNLVVGQEITVEVLIEDAPTIYGADVRLTFDPALLEVVDADAKLDGIQLMPGDFIDSTNSFVLQHQADNQAGTIDYALALLNPAPPVKGNGRLVEVRFRAKAKGQITVSIIEGLFGTQNGETIAPNLNSLNLQVTPTGGSPLDQITQPVHQLLEDPNSQLPTFGILIVLGLGGVIVLAGLLAAGLGRRRRPQG